MVGPSGWAPLALRALSIKESEFDAPEVEAVGLPPRVLRSMSALAGLSRLAATAAASSAEPPRGPSWTPRSHMAASSSGRAQPRATKNWPTSWSS